MKRSATKINCEHFNVELNQFHRSNFGMLADYLETGFPIAPSTVMEHGPAAGVSQIIGESYRKYWKRAFGMDDQSLVWWWIAWMDWRRINTSPDVTSRPEYLKESAVRIRYMLTHGIPTFFNWHLWLDEDVKKPTTNSQP